LTNLCSCRTHPEAQKLADDKAIGTLAKTTQAIAILVKTTYQSDRSLQKPGYPEVKKPSNNKAIATLAKTTPSDRSSCKNYTSDRLCQSLAKLIFWILP